MNIPIQKLLVLESAILEPHTIHKVIVSCIDLIDSYSHRYKATLLNHTDSAIYLPKGTILDSDKHVGLTEYLLYDSY